MPRILPCSLEGIQTARQHLLGGKLVAFPTETVYGLGALATCKKAVEAVYFLKKRPFDKPFILHGAEASDVWPYAIENAQARLLADSFWPGPLTLVLKRRLGTALEKSMPFKDSTIAIRVIDHPVATSLIHGLEAPLVASSANSSGFLSPTTAADVAGAFPEEDLLILDGGQAHLGIESTILDLTHDNIRILRQGAVFCEAIEHCLGVSITSPETNTAEQGQNPLMLRLNAEIPHPDEAFLAFGHAYTDFSCVAQLNLSPSGNLTEAAKNLFPMLRQLKSCKAQTIAVMPIPQRDLGMAINERLEKFRIEFAH
ncbi:MAG: threonylcarbamoyl-AMP synthase [Holosporales bacterium]|jgi:L-threonylcarbamoyladenylate synthase|nr:threonylcarbamoyl-AMP synthase [Holosporales bacterium]